MNAQRIRNWLFIALVMGQVIGGMWLVAKTHEFAEETTARMEAYRSQ